MTFWRRHGKQPAKDGNWLGKAIDFSPKQAAGPYKIGIQYGRIGIVAAEIGEIDIADQILAYLTSTVPDATVCVPLQAAVAMVSDHDRALALLNDAHRLVLADDDPFDHEAVNALFEAAAAVDRLVARKLLATSLARSSHTRTYLPQAVRVDASLAQFILELFTGGE